MLKPVVGWTSVEVGKWVAALGLPQYRKRFIHQAITGALLLDLKASHLKAIFLPMSIQYLKDFWGAGDYA